MEPPPPAASSARARRRAPRRRGGCAELRQRHRVEGRPATAAAPRPRRRSALGVLRHWLAREQPRRVRAGVMPKTASPARRLSRRPRRRSRASKPWHYRIAHEFDRALSYRPHRAHVCVVDREVRYAHDDAVADERDGVATRAATATAGPARDALRHVVADRRQAVVERARTRAAPARLGVAPEAGACCRSPPIAAAAFLILRALTSSQDHKLARMAISWCCTTSRVCPVRRRQRASRQGIAAHAAYGRSAAVPPRSSALAAPIMLRFNLPGLHATHQKLAWHLHSLCLTAGSKDLSIAAVQKSTIAWCQPSPNQSCRQHSCTTAPGNRGSRLSKCSQPSARTTEHPSRESSNMRASLRTIIVLAWPPPTRSFASRQH